MAPYETCTYVLTRGTVCGSPALTGEKLCYFHHRDHQRKLNFQEARQLKTSDHFYKYPEQQKLLDPEILESIDIPALEDREAIQVAITNIVRAALSGHISEKRAGLALFGCQVAVSNIGKTRIGLCQFESEKVATTDPNPIRPLIEVQPPKAGYQDDLAAARKLITAAQKLKPPTQPPVRQQAPPAENADPQIRQNDEFSSKGGGGTTKEGAPSNRSGFERLGGTATNEAPSNSKPDVRVWHRPPGPNSKTFADHVKIAAALYKGTVAADQFKREQKQEERNQRNGSTGSTT